MMSNENVTNHEFVDLFEFHNVYINLFISIQDHIKML
jgi:hypothetical protein